jgi:REP element-mobilizing transposase RayT
MNMVGLKPNRGLHSRKRPEVWNLRTHRCFRALQRAFARGCERFGFRLIHFSVQRNHVHCIVEAPDAVALGRAMKASRCGRDARLLCG